jgi:hypothetical protein
MRKLELTLLMAEHFMRLPVGDRQEAKTGVFSEGVRRTLSQLTTCNDNDVTPCYAAVRITSFSETM